MSMYNLIEYSDNYSDSTASLYQYKRQEQNYAANGNVDNITVDDSSSFIKWKCSLEKCSIYCSAKMYFILL